MILGELLVIGRSLGGGEVTSLGGGGACFFLGAFLVVFFLDGAMVMNDVMM